MSGPNASVSRWATPAVEEHQPGVEREQRAELHDAPAAGGQLAHQVVGVAVQPEVADDLLGLLALGALGEG